MVDETLRTIEETLIDVAPTIRRGFHGRDRNVGKNPSGERQRSGDVMADDVLAGRLGDIDGVGEYASEERESVTDVGEGLALSVDPLDGSSNLPTNNPVGTIVGAYEGSLPAAGDRLLGAWFVLYGPLTTIVGTTGEEVTETTLDDGGVARERTIQLPESPGVYGIGGRPPEWEPSFASVVDQFKREYKCRYGGAMVADVNQVLHHGGIFSYPALDSAPMGKLRLQFEGIPMAGIVQTAGGRSSNGTQSLLAIEPQELHQRSPVHIGNRALIEAVEAASRET